MRKAIPSPALPRPPRLLPFRQIQRLRIGVPRFSAAVFCAAILFCVPPVSGAQPEPALEKEGARAVKNGVAYLLKAQKEDGSLGSDPAFTALAIVALKGSRLPEAAKGVERARKYLLSCARGDGSFYGKYRQYVNYTTSIALSALALLRDPADREIMKRARKYILDSQLDEDHPTHPTQREDPYYGGIGYGKMGPSRPDLSNTHLALEALHLTEDLDASDTAEGNADAKRAALAWEKARKFLSKVQNMPEDASETWIASDTDPKNDGGFIYMPGNSKASEKLKEKTTLRSYGSMTCAGLKSMLYAKMRKDDVRVRAAVAWASAHYTLDENPNMGAEGHFYYLLTFAKALSAYGEDTLKGKDGTKYWRNDLIRKIVPLQRPDGSWANTTGRWMESNPELSTCYLLAALELALNK